MIEKMEKITGLFNTLIRLSKEGEELARAGVLAARLRDVMEAEDDAEKIEILRVFANSCGGQGSLSDCCLQQEGKILFNETGRFYRILEQLCSECDALRVKKLSSRLADTFWESQYDNEQIGEYDCLLYRPNIPGSCGGRFFCANRPSLGENYSIGEQPLPIRPPNYLNMTDWEWHAVKVTEGSLLRVGNVTLPEGSHRYIKRQFYMDQAWYGLPIMIEQK